MLDLLESYDLALLQDLHRKMLHRARLVRRRTQPDEQHSAKCPRPYCSVNTQSRNLAWKLTQCLNNIEIRQLDSLARILVPLCSLLRLYFFSARPCLDLGTPRIRGGTSTSTLIVPTIPTHVYIHATPAFGGKR
jgi:hypothetical protein